MIEAKKMNIQLIKKPFSVELYGISGKVINHDYAGAGRPMMDKMWKIIKTQGLKHKGINYWAYDNDTSLFVGVEMETPPPQDSGLEHKKFSMPEYAYYKHIGPYDELKDVYPAIAEELKKQGLQMAFPGLEIYGHWNEDVSKLETEILVSYK